MLFIILAVLVSSTMTVVFKVAGVKRWNTDHMMLVNYATALLFSLTDAAASNQLSALRAVNEVNFQTLLTDPTPGNSIAVALILGTVLGCIFMPHLAVTKASIVKNGAGLSTFFSKAAFLGAIPFTALIWKEIPTALQWVGIGLIVIALILMSGDLKNLQIESPRLFLLLMLFGTVVELIYKTFAEYALPEHKPVFMLVVFSFAFLVCIVHTIRITRREGVKFRLTMPEIIFGISLGAANVLTSLFQLRALEALPASVVFPSISAGSLLLIYVISVVFFYESFRKNRGAQ